MIRFSAGGGGGGNLLKGCFLGDGGGVQDGGDKVRGNNNGNMWGNTNGKEGDKQEKCERVRG